jgi:hypothetical protein
MGQGGLGWGGGRDADRRHVWRGGPGVGPNGGLGRGSERLLLENHKRSSVEAKLIEVSPVKNGTQTSASPLMLEWKEGGVIGEVDKGA